MHIKTIVYSDVSSVSATKKGRIENSHNLGIPSSELIPLIMYIVLKVKTLMLKMIMRMYLGTEILNHTTKLI